MKRSILDVVAALAWTLVPVCLGVFVSLMLTGFSVSTNEERIIRLVGFMVGWSLGFTVQLSRLSYRLGDVLGTVAEHLDLFKILHKGGPVFLLLRRIVSLSERFEDDIDHLPNPHKKAVHRWVATYLDKVETQCAKFAANKSFFHGDAGMQVDLNLVTNATVGIRASTYVTTDSVDFWVRSKMGEKYREACHMQSQKLGRAKFSEANELLSGVARIFSIDATCLKQAADGTKQYVDLIEGAIAEVERQLLQGIDVRLLHQAEMLDQEVAVLDVLVVDGVLSSTTKKLEVGGVARRVEVSWQKAEVNEIARDWDLLWEMGSTVEQFRKYLEEETNYGNR